MLGRVHLHRQHHVDRRPPRPTAPPARSRARPRCRTCRSPASRSPSPPTASRRSTTSPLGALPISALNTLLKELGITIAVTNATDKVSGPSASRELDGLEIQINLDTLDTAANKFASLLPAKLISQLPVAIPNEQLITLYFGRVQVSSTASPNFVASNSGSTGAAARRPRRPRPARRRPATPAAAASPATRAAAPAAASPATPAAASDRRPSGTRRHRLLAGRRRPRPPPWARRSRGSAPRSILLGLLAAAALAYLYKRADDLTEALGTTCSDGDPLMERFNVTPDELTDFGGFG